MMTDGENRQNVAVAPDFLQLHGGDHPGMVLFSAPFDGIDFLAWKRSVVIALRAKMKLGFIDGRYNVPDSTSGDYETWIRVDSMVTSWILNAMTKKVSKAFLYAKSSRQLWLDLEERYGENNGPLVYQLRRAIASVTQGTSTVVDYFNNLTALWDELECLMPTKTCTCGLCVCGFTKTTAEEDNLTKLVQFLMGLDYSYDGIRNQILIMDPFPSINKAYSMVLRVERQRLVNMQNSDNSDGVVLHTKWTDNKGGIGQRSGYKGKGTVDKRSITCSNCGKSGHVRETCFKLHGVPDCNAIAFGEAMKRVTEFLKLMKGQPAAETDPLKINFAQGADFAGSSLLTHTHKLINKSLVHLPDGSSQPVKLTGDDQRTKATLAVGKVLGGLYIIDNSSFTSSVIEHHPVSVSPSLHCNMSSAFTNTLLWHK
ncbi:UNVERIFIED_CONTAM: hypothetical protein Slati_2861100, partial [Sesamum latifolium]